MRSTSLTLLALVVGAAAAVVDYSSACSGFTPTGIPNVELTNPPTYFHSNAVVDISNAYSSINESTLPAFCRVELTITTNTTAGSTALAEVWLPDNWNGRMLTVGNGGISGGVTVTELGHVAVPQGFAGVSTNTGHNGTTNEGAWAGPGNDNAIVDWGWRAMHMTVIAGKEVIKQYYLTPAKKSYYLSCSNGGRQGLKEVQEFPDDFDGVVVGSPANWWTHVQSWSIHMNLNVQPSTSPHFMMEDTWKNLIASEVLKQCDALDGLADGIVSDPRNCKFQPETLLCSSGQNVSTCLTEDQVSALRNIYSDYYEGNEYVFAGYYPGGEADYYHGLVGKTQFKIGRSFFQYMVINDTDWKIHDYNASVLALVDEINPGQGNAASPNITAFVGPQHNGKLIHYVGYADQLISPGNSIHYFESGGYGANAFGAVEQASNSNPPLSNDPEHNILSAIVRWVEEGIAPENFTAAYYIDNDVANGVGFTRPLCKYPSALKYKSGDNSSADSFECVLD
ncbi:hypothetical protein GSI_02370 [Ganoderma sinense ZZ0214-1]|uniref:Carboxylic ester hydrolase n=1 Tax=Ganoderma sinense ZZ0214-1 TaxID=1077348 RepID=A0A2G8SPE3_9APHY|nr:hypothetical protein GSI_02370 [Ganoderma sinense ZZ0214-1]